MFPGIVHAKFHESGCIPLSTFPRNGQNMALLCPKHGPHSPPNSFFPNHYQCAQECFIPNFTILDVSHSSFFLEMAKYGSFMVKTWSLHGPLNWFFLNHNQCAQGCPMLNYTCLGVSHCPLFLEMANIWPFYCQNMVLIWSF